MGSLTKARQFFLYIAPFPALVFFKIWASLGRDPHELLIGAAVMFVYCMVILTVALKWDKPTYFYWAVTGYFFVVLLSLIFSPETLGPVLGHYAITGIYMCLFVVAFFPPLLGMDPFTYHYAKKSAPEAVWNTDVFITINRVMTLVWSGVFGLCCLLSIYPSVITRAIIPITVIIGTALIFNRRFPNYYLRRLGLSSTAVSAFEHSSEKPLDHKTTRDWSQSSSNCPGAVESIQLDLPDVGRRARNIEDSQTLERTKPMKVIAINSSPKGEGRSRTGLLLDSLTRGMREAGAEVTTVHLRDKQVRHCVGCFTCWTKTPGTCVHKDDMTKELFPVWLNSDLCVYASPLYHFTVNATMKNFIERTLPMVEPFFVDHDGRTSHPWRQTPPRSVILSVAGFPELSVFNQLSSYAHFLFGKGLVAEIYHPGAEWLGKPHLAKETETILKATVQAGKELVESGTIKAETMRLITKPLMDPLTLASMTNIFWRTCIDEGLNPREFETRGMVPSPDSIESFIMIMSWGFNRNEAAAMNATIQFLFTGEIEGGAWFKISDGNLSTGNGVSDSADLTIETPFGLWVDIMRGKADGQTMFMQQKYTTRGDFSLLIRLKDLFGKRSDL